MNFLNIALLGGVLAFSIPVIIHLLNRSRFRVVHWGAMHLLEPIIRVNRRRIRIEQIILLIVRAAIPALLALLMARPVITGWRSLAGQAKTSLVMLFDNSYSMEAGGAASSNLTKAQQQSAAVIGGLPRGSDVSIVLMAGGRTAGSDAPTSDLNRASSELVKLNTGYGAADVPRSFETGMKRLGDMQHAKRDVVVMSDFQEADWKAEKAPVRARLTELVKSLPVPPSLTFFKAGAQVKDNVAVQGLDMSRFVVGVGQELQVRANIKNYGEAPYPNLRVYFRADGHDVSASEINLGPGESGQVLFTHKFDTPGSHVIEVMADADTLKADNSYMASIPVWDRIPVLLVNGDPSPQPLEGETDFLEVALQPFAAGKVEMADLVQTQVIELADLKADALAEKRLVVLANVRQLSDAQRQALEQFVEQGNALLIFAGTKLDTDWYNTALFASGNGLLPLRLGAVSGNSAGAEVKASIVAQHFDHPALELFNDPRNGNVADADVRTWYKLDETASPTTDVGLAVVARLDSGDPFLVEKRFGRGRVLQCATSCDADWSNLPMRPFFLPLVQQLVTYMAASVDPPRNVEVGKPLVAFLPRQLAGTNAILTDPDGKRHEVSIVDKGSRGVVEWGQTDRPGLYVLEPTGLRPVHFVVNTTRSESDLRLLKDDALAQVAQEMGASVVRSWEQYHELDATRRHGRELWQGVFWVMLLLVFAELMLEQFFTRRKV